MISLSRILKLNNYILLLFSRLFPRSPPVCDDVSFFQLSFTYFSRFYRCHRSYIVNKHNIKEIDFKQSIVYMTNGETCLLSVRMKKGLKH